MNLYWIYVGLFPKYPSNNFINFILLLGLEDVFWSVFILYEWLINAIVIKV